MTGGCVYRHGESEYWLVYTADAYFELNERYGADFLEEIRPATREAWNIAVGCICVLAREGELCRRFMGLDPTPFLDEETVRRTVLPDGISNVKKAVFDTFICGMHIDVESEGNEPVDIRLMEYEKKTRPAPN